MGVCSHTLTSWSRKQHGNVALIVLESEVPGPLHAVSHFLLSWESTGKALLVCSAACWVCIQLEEKRNKNSGVKGSKGQIGPYGKNLLGTVRELLSLKAKVGVGLEQD